MKVIDIALKDVIRSMRNASAVFFMFGIPLLVTGMFYFMFGNIYANGGFELARVSVAVANLDEGGPNLHLKGRNIPGDFDAHTMGELVVEILKSDDLVDLVEVIPVPDAAAARAVVDAQQVKVAVILPADFSDKFADSNEQASIEFYQDPTLIIGPAIIKTILNQFTDGIAGIKIASTIATDKADTLGGALVGKIVQAYVKSYLDQDTDLSDSMLDIHSAKKAAQDTSDPLLGIIGRVMGGMMIFYAFYTGTNTASTILHEEEERTLQRLFTTPTPRVTILSGKFLSVFLTVIVQNVVLLIAAWLIFGINWGALLPLSLTVAGIVLSASSMGIFVCSLMKNTKQGSVVFGGVLTLSGMLGMISVFAGNTQASLDMSRTVALLVPQGWGMLGISQTMNADPVGDVLLTLLGMLGWSAVFFTVGIWRFNRRFA